jgi:hypothetical protein
MGPMPARPALLSRPLCEHTPAQRRRRATRWPRPRLFRVPVRQEFHRALEIGKQDRDLLALTFQGGLRSEDFLDQMTWGVTNRWLEVWRGWCCWPPTERCAAFAAELGPWEHVRPALGAAGPQGGAILDAELSPLGSVSFAVWAAHREALRYGRASGRGVDGQEPQHPPLIDLSWMVCQYSRCGQVSSEKHETAANAGAEEEG